MAKAVYPGSFDPITNGHLDIISRASSIFDSIVVAVYDTPSKSLMFNTNERVSMCKEAVVGIKNVEVLPYVGLTVTFAKKINAGVLLRGLRALSDFESEYAMALMNKHLSPEIEDVYMMSGLDNQYLSSSLLKEVAKLEGDITDLVPTSVAQALKGKLGK